MAEEQKQGQQGQQGAPSTEDSKGTRVGELRGIIREELKNILPEMKGLFGNKEPDAPPIGQPTQAQQTQDIKGEVAKALEVLSKREKAQKRDEEIDKFLEAQKQGTAAPPVPPKEISKVHKFMGWGE